MFSSFNNRLDSIFRNFPSFAGIIFKCVEQGDAVANEILDRNINRLARQLSAALDMFDKDTKIPIVLSGGITNMSNQFLDKLNQNINSKCPREIKILKEEPVTGAVLAAGVLVKENNNA
jgi:N-acetylglucosamine kinase-like BadF-type ATPase